MKFGREKAGLDLSDVVLTHHRLIDRGQQNLALSDKDAPKLAPITAAGSGSVQEKQQAYLIEIIEQLNDLFGTDTSDGDKLSLLRTMDEKLLESSVLQQQSLSNSEEQFRSSPDLLPTLQDAAIDVMDIQTELVTRLLNEPAKLQHFLNTLLLNGLYEKLRARASGV